MRRRPAANSVSLFPFLAVLLCAMGALILLLVVLTTQIREDAQRFAAPARKPVPAEVRQIAVDPPAAIERIVVTVPAPPALPQPRDPNIPLRARLHDLETELFSAQQLAERARLTTVQKQHLLAVSQSRLSSRQLEMQAAQARLAARHDAMQQRAAQKQELLESVQLAQGSLQSALQAAAAAEPKVSIIPYDGRSGTPRRPILIECTADAIRFLPEDISLTAADLEGFLPDYNPLLAGAVALRSHWLEVDGSAGPKPYVLLLVHEDGVAAYYASRTLLRSLGGETGYELVTEDLKLALPPFDPVAAKVCRQAVLEALRQRTALLAEVSRREGSNGSLFPTGRFEVDPGEHDPTREKSLWGGGTRNSASQPAAPPTNPAESLAQSRRGPAAPMVSPTAAGTSPAGAVAQQIAALNRERRREREASQSAADDRLLERALAERLPSFTASRGGKRQWGQSSPTASISLERPIEIEISRDQIVVGDQPPIELGSDGVTETAVEQFLDAVGQAADAWGQAPGQFYWSPRLRAAVQPGAMLQFNRLEGGLSGSGLNVTSRIVLEPTAPAFLEVSDATPSP